MLAKVTLNYLFSMAIITQHQNVFQGDNDKTTLFQIIQKRKKETDNKKNKQIEEFKAALRNKKCS